MRAMSKDPIHPVDSDARAQSVLQPEASQESSVDVRCHGAAPGSPVGLGGTSWRCGVPQPSAVVTMGEQVEESRIAVIKAWTHPESGEVLCKITSSSDTSSDAAEDAMRIEGIDDAVTWFEQWLTEFQYD